MDSWQQLSSRGSQAGRLKGPSGTRSTSTLLGVSRTRRARFLNAKRWRPEPCLIFPKRKGRIVLRTCAGAERTVGRESRTARRKKARHKDHTKRAQVIEPICAAPPPRLVPVPVPGLLVLAKETVHVPSPNTDVMCMPISPLVSCQRVGSAWRYGWMVHHETARHAEPRLSDQLQR